MRLKGHPQLLGTVEKTSESRLAKMQWDIELYCLKQACQKSVRC